MDSINNDFYEQYGVDELENVVDDVATALKNRKKVMDLLAHINTIGGIKTILEVLNLQNRLQTNKKTAQEDTAHHGSIIVTGATPVCKNTLCNIAEEFGIDAKRLQLHLEYNKLQKFDYSYTKNNNNVACIITSYQPHKGVSAEGHRSVISAITRNPNFPPVLTLFGNNGLTANSFKKALMELTETGIIAINNKEILHC